MRNPIRLKNLNVRFLPFYVAGVGLLAFFSPSPLGFALSVPFFLVGLGLRSWGAGHLVKNDALIMTGPYAYLRHPLYAGTILIATGFAVLFVGWLGLALVAGIWPWFAFRYFPRKESSEGARLEALYGYEFASYREAVPALWPRWGRRKALGSTGHDSDENRQWTLHRYSENNELGTLIAVIGALCLLWFRVGWAPA